MIAHWRDDQMQRVRAGTFPRGGSGDAHAQAGEGCHSGLALRRRKWRSFGGEVAYEIGAAIEKHAESKSKEKLHVFEDGLWTGIELKKVLDALLGKVVPGKEPKVMKLRNPGLLSDVDIELHYLLQTDLGRNAAISLLKTMD
jgi:hypothetical protein